MKSANKMLCLVNLPNGTTFGIQCDPKAIGQKCLEEVSLKHTFTFIYIYISTIYLRDYNTALVHGMWWKGGEHTDSIARAVWVSVCPHQ